MACPRNLGRPRLSRVRRLSRLLAIHRRLPYHRHRRRVRGVDGASGARFPQHLDIRAFVPGSARWSVEMEADGIRPIDLVYRDTVDEIFKQIYRDQRFDVMPSENAPLPQPRGEYTFDPRGSLSRGRAKGTSAADAFCTSRRGWGGGRRRHRRTSPRDSPDGLSRPAVP